MRLMPLIVMFASILMGDALDIPPIAPWVLVTVTVRPARQVMKSWSSNNRPTSQLPLSMTPDVVLTERSRDRRPIPSAVAGRLPIDSCRVVVARERQAQDLTDDAWSPAMTASVGFL